MNWDVVYKVVIILLLVLSVFFNLFLTFNEFNYINERVDGIDWKLRVLERYKMYDETVNFSEIVNGVNHLQTHYCVWTENRTFEEINDTDYHEVCHELIYKDLSNHFCDEETIKNYGGENYEENKDRN